MSIQNKTIAFAGAGNMAEAIIGGIIKSGTLPADQIIAFDINTERLDHMASAYGVVTGKSLKEAYEIADIIVLSVKPQVMPSVLSELADGNHGKLGKRLIISIAAGIRTKKFESILYNDLTESEKQNLPIIRVMPNTPGLVLAGMSGICANSAATDADIQIAETILSSMGKVLKVEEDKMDAVTAVSGSGPAYFFYFIESMVEAAVGMGLSREEALTLSVTTMSGAAKLLETSDDSPEVLRQKVTSPGGTTEAALKVMISSGTGKIISDALNAAAERSKELSG